MSLISRHAGAVVARLHHQLGQRFEILYTGIKPYACCRQHHSAIDAILEIKVRENLRADQVATVKLRTFVVAAHGTSKAPDSVRAAKYSAPDTIALALALGKNRREQYAMDLINDPSLSASKSASASTSTRAACRDSARDCTTEC